MTDIAREIMEFVKPQETPSGLVVVMSAINGRKVMTISAGMEKEALVYHVKSGADDKKATFAAQDLDKVVDLMKMATPGDNWWVTVHIADEDRRHAVASHQSPSPSASKVALYKKALAFLVRSS